MFNISKKLVGIFDRGDRASGSEIKKALEDLTGLTD